MNRSEYEKEVRQWRKEHHICTRCGKRDAAIGFALCPVCQQYCYEYSQKFRAKHPDRVNKYAKNSRLKKINAGLCVKCGKPNDNGKRMCTKCAKSLWQHEKQQKITNMQYVIGCIRCGDVRMPGKKMCSNCYIQVCKNLEIAREAAKAARKPEGRMGART